MAKTEMEIDIETSLRTYVTELSPEALGQIVEAVNGDKITVSLPLAIKKLTDALVSDPDYRRSWQASIAMAFQDELGEARDIGNLKLDEIDFHRVSNEAASRFLDNLTREVK